MDYLPNSGEIAHVQNIGGKVALNRIVCIMVFVLFAF